jgi:ubiquinone/menaquinone biosynthesis C-methylase UbiE
MPIEWDQEYEKDCTPLWETEIPEEILIQTLQQCAPRFVLDAGCGIGTDLIWMAGKRIRATGIDISHKGLTRAKRRLNSENLPVPLAQSNVLMLPFSDATFDFVNDRGCFHHMEPGSRRQYAREVSRVLKTSGHLLLRCFSEKYFKGGGAGYPLTEKDIRDTFASYFHIDRITDYASTGDSIPVDMCWSLMEKISDVRG